MNFDFNFPDMDECVDGSHSCSHICENTQGSYSCSCHSGYHLSIDGFNCQGVYHDSSLYTCTFHCLEKG